MKNGLRGNIIIMEIMIDGPEVPTINPGFHINGDD
jgi:hypothetical protein